MSNQRTNRRVLRFGIEQSYNADTVPDMAAILPTSIDVTPLAGNDIDRSYIRPYYGNAPQAPGEKHVQVQVGVELTTSGTPGTPPPWGTLLQVCGFAETVEAAVEADPDNGVEARSARVVYTPISDQEESGRLYCHVDKTLHEGRGARGTVQIALNAESIPTLSMTMMALLRPIVDAALPTVDLSPWRPAPAVNTQNTGPLTVFGLATPFNQFSLDMAVQTRHRTVVDANDIAITGRQPSGSMQIDDPGVATVNYFQRAQGVEAGEIRIVHGTEPGSIVEIVMPRCTIQSPSYADDEGVQMLTIPYTPEPLTGNDEIQIICR
ncbi:phage tail tube protein [Salinicola sp. JS01]|uniref:phage tail tube protein n=1 Tax=Salinicola sp. JS01 TaxID=3050071 RepID=UPI00255BE5B4|nr:phage tail tube protein [Salinicola sp. JS01]WIX34962.1 phage tail tube protein [Salinicola sp. JS01]